MSSTAALSGSSQAPRPMAVIDIGATSIRMAVGEISEQGHVRVIDTLSQAVSLGKDAFTRGRIDKSTIEDCVRVLKTYRRKLREYQINGSDRIRVAATSAVREATNRLALIDRVYIATGLEVEPLDEAEVTRLTFLGVQPQLASDPRFADVQTLVVEVGGGSTEVLLIRDSNVVFSYTYRLGSMRLHRMLEEYRAPTMKLRAIMENQIARTVGQICRRVDGSAPVEMIALGGDVRFAVAELLPDWDRRELATVPVAALRRLTDNLLESTVDELVQQHHLNFSEAETIGPALLTYVALAEALEIEHFHVTNVNLRDGLLEEMAIGQIWTEEFRNQVIRSAIDIADKYSCDRAHAVQVADLSRMLFRELLEEHQLDSRYEILLYTAALLHETGLFISNRGYHKHSMYVIRNSEIFGLGKSELLMVSLTARYHRRASPQPTHDGFTTLDRDRRVAIAKMAAILRIAVSLDESRTQRINEITCRRRKGQLVITVHGLDDVSLEQLAIRQSGSMFEEVFGLVPILQPVG